MDASEYIIKEVKGAAGCADECSVRLKYEAITRCLIQKGITLTTMESCTSGQVASLITDTEGSSAIFKGAFITYSNETKIQMGVDARVIEKYGVYSLQTAAAMARGCRKAFGVDIGIGVTGSFGNADPNNADSVPGEVCFAISAWKNTQCCHCTLPLQPSRYAYKIYMADVIADALSALIGI